MYVYELCVKYRPTLFCVPSFSPEYYRPTLFWPLPNIIALPFSVFPLSRILPFFLSRILSSYPTPSLPNIICPFNWNTIVRALFCFFSLSSEIVYKNTTSVSIFHFLKYFLKYSVFSLPIFIVIPYSVFPPSLPNISTL